MATFAANKRKYASWLSGADWKEHLPKIIADGNSGVSPLFSLLPGQDLRAHRAAYALGLLLAALAQTEPEKARIAIRRFMWHMSEESGNIGWGIPEAFSESLAASPMLANEYKSILLSYIMDLGFEDNYCDNDILRRSCYWAVGNFAAKRPELAEKARPWLIKGLADSDPVCRGMAAWALGKLGVEFSDIPALEKLAKAADETTCAIYEDDSLREATVSSLAREALEKVKI